MGRGAVFHRLSQADEVAKIEATLKEAGELIAANKFDCWRVEDEDIHMNLERFLYRKTRRSGKKMHFGRSRNDLIATTLRLFTHDQLEIVKGKTKRLLQAHLKQAKETVGIIVPAKTHLQNAQPMRLAQLFLTYAQELKRDMSRIEIAQARAMEYMPMGSAACTVLRLISTWGRSHSRLVSLLGLSTATTALPTATSCLRAFRQWLCKGSILAVFARM
jgi:argininosuccinate lyase